MLKLILRICCIGAILAANSVAYASTKASDGEPQWPASMVSGKIPVVYINTENAAMPIEKDDKIPATIYIDPKEKTEYESLGTADVPLKITFSGRGNATWSEPKKPFKIKFEKKTSVLGLPKHKTWALMAHINESGKVWCSNLLGFEVARVLGMPWAPHMIPVELVINGQYEGSYFLQETIKIDKGRLNIYEQADGETDPSLIPYGWLIEIDNYSEEGQFRLPDPKGGGADLKFTFKSPEELSSAQREWVSEELTRLTGLINDSDPDDDTWAQHIDANSAARYFIIRELLHDYDAYNGSFYIHRDKEEGAKWQFGPIWDCCSNRYDKKDYICYDPETPSYTAFHWMRQIMLHPAFTKAFKEEWQKFYTPENIQKLLKIADDYESDLGSAFEANNKRWKDILPDFKLHFIKYQMLDGFKRPLQNNGAWMNEHQDIAEYARKALGVKDVMAEGSKIFTLKGTLLIINEDAIQSGSAFLSDASGRKVMSLSGNECDLTSLQKGIYLVVATSKQGTPVSAKIAR